MKFFIIAIAAAFPTYAFAQSQPPMSDAQLRAALVVLTDEKNAAEMRAYQALSQLETVTKERDALKAAASQPMSKDDKK